MRKSKFDPELKAEVLAKIKTGMPVKDIASSTGIPVTTISNWKSELNKNNGGSKKKPKANGRSIEQQLQDSEYTRGLVELENDALRRMVNEPDATRWPTIEIVYLRERLALLGDKWVKPLGEMPKVPEEAEKQE